ncbi:MULTISPECIES: dienelactone hydrolase family protein [unclassified Mucilaginibacter]|uniref:alpha/beta hydrolase n=1 Tax=unclassified Mucilaginibacter TaxID=2617802 RepID=UPI002AC902A1|nr:MULTISPECIES: dienelactone hydrolase family protein [unclassified Mucilaginibacter]MEB0260124.1 dienelactone hydrolase family protein [Mucilaginibacter sp. 10I4]MEB0279155.1 dienelactone hydrolase family protein [Mucilaginibacter sp. 10B2]MEB0301588.1 dienelactone hydrolase family protein [Mucilaginibacter sp. 5C4]WPX22333.1 dienelactone hydrolase family protein [Mucilaginibacter sp. 5C4]
MYTHSKQISIGGAPAANAKAALIMLHGRGASALDIMRLAGEFNAKDIAIYAPQATNNSWYPYSFLAPVEENEPALSSALSIIDEVVEQALADGFTADEIYFAGFSQGACLTLEYITRNAKQYGGAVAFTGGLIGEELNIANYKGDFACTPVLITTGDPDPHVPVSRVQESVEVLKGMNANVTLKIYKGRQHTISFDEIALANQLVFK